jgi:hypothetical protein
VALMVLDHQAKMHNYITRLNFEARTMIAMYGHTRYLTNQVNAFLRYLLFVEETPLGESVSGDSAFVAAFEAQGPRDSKGRSLREIDGKKRLFRYPCSFLINSEAFDALPPVIRTTVLDRLFAILRGRDKEPIFARISEEDRKAIFEILVGTKSNLPPEWKSEGL